MATFVPPPHIFGDCFETVMNRILFPSKTSLTAIQLQHAFVFVFFHHCDICCSRPFATSRWHLFVTHSVIIFTTAVCHPFCETFDEFFITHSVIIFVTAVHHCWGLARMTQSSESRTLIIENSFERVMPSRRASKSKTKHF